jgi:hypothetical protein
LTSCSRKIARACIERMDDGTKVRANASKHKAMSYDRMTKADAEFATVVKDWPTAAEWAFVCTAHNLLKRIRASV